MLSSVLHDTIYPFPFSVTKFCLHIDISKENIQGEGVLRIAYLISQNFSECYYDILYNFFFVYAIHCYKDFLTYHHFSMQVKKNKSQKCQLETFYKYYLIKTNIYSVLNG